VEELFLSLFLAFEKLDVVDQKDVDVTVTVSEVVGLVVLDRVDELVGEGLARDVNDLSFGICRNHAVTDRVHEVRFPQTYTAVQEERIVSAAGRLRHRLGGGVREPVALADDEGFKRIAPVQLARATLGGAERPAGRGFERLVTARLDDHEARLYASQGQQRSAVLSLKLAELHYLAEVTGEQPVLLLDDVMSELDPARRERLLAALEPGPQALITAADLNDLPKSILERAAVFRVEQGGIHA